MLFERIQKLLDRLEFRIALWTIFQGSGIVSVGAITGWLSTGVDWINHYGAFGWWAASLFGASIASVTVLGFSFARLSWIKASAVNKWKKDVDSINPMDSSFSHKRINLI